MFKGLLASITLVPVLLGMLVAGSRRWRQGLLLLLGSVLAYDFCYLILLYFLRYRWVG